MSLLIAGRSDLPGPITHYATDYNGVIWVIAAGRANVNGANRGVPNIPAGDGNAQLLGNEVFTNGTQPMPAVQRDAIFLSSAVVLRHFGRDIDGYLYRHQDTSKTGKWDIGQLTTAELRAGTKAALKRLQTGTPIEEDNMANWEAKQLKELFAQTLRENLGDIATRDEKSWWRTSQLGLIQDGATAVLRTEGVSGAGDLGRTIAALAPLVGGSDENELSEEDVRRVAEAVQRLDVKAVAEQLAVVSRDDV
jgi:hypothetical protein